MSSRPIEKAVEDGGTLPVLNPTLDADSAPEKVFANVAEPTSTGARLLSLDVFRALVVAVMTLVNYLAPIKGVPTWAKHWPETLEGYTFVDVVFPAFLFMVGVAIPFALQRRLDRGDSPVALVGKIALRSGALLLLGVITANDHTYASGAAILSKAWWFSLTLLCVTGLWTACPSQATLRRRNLHLIIRIVCSCGLAVLLPVPRQG
jgi:predicted acyltransferase